MVVSFLVVSVNAQPLEFFDDRGAFEAACPGLANEDFEGFSGALGGVVGIGNEINSMTMDGPIMPGDVIDGFNLTTVNNITGLVILDPLFFEFVPSVIVGANNFGDFTRVEFDPPVSAAGLDTFAPAVGGAPGTLEFTFFNGDKALGSTIVDILPTAYTFMGAKASGGEVITRMEVTNEFDSLGGQAAIGDLVDNLAFLAAGDDCILGDVNGDTVVDLLDVNPFVDAVLSGTFSCEADVNEDTVVDLLDVNPFVALILGG